MEPGQVQATPVVGMGSFALLAALPRLRRLTGEQGAARSRPKRDTVERNARFQRDTRLERAEVPSKNR